MQGFLDGLTQAEREVLVLWLWEDLKPPQIAEMLGLRPRTVQKRIERGLARLRSQWGGPAAETKNELPESRP